MRPYSSSTSSAYASAGIGLPGLTFLVLLVLKLTGNITWSWWWVTCPLWGSFVLFVIFFIVLMLIGARYWMD